MWTPILLVYGAGLAGTAIALLRTQTVKHDRLMNGASIVLWPLYWSYFGLTLFISRRRS